ncbi:TetR/AcrR family transcriptional regulator [Arthrobacter glacialis]|uniref:TetR family transcriptional regulator n=1 Tax=Arthrobacter glacialis TaxID=1664 RepID=A0A2S3ZWC1_ARTGL|nr:TetR/AcrR family transcriptional regulator [Arthrobacter glacialis]POH58964.1 TetR family transcriptional regulator [Arthrobacter glacialis]POH73565.1 TetR family transcriptional regulator [Arthrobacter glacialis]
MAARGSYAKGIAKRDEILTTALRVIAERGYRKTSLRELAAAVGLSQTGLLHYFGTKEDLFIEVLRKRDDVDMATYGPDANQTDVIQGILNVIRHNADVPGLVHLYTQFSAEASEASHPAHGYFQERSAYFRQIVSGAIREQQETGQLSAALDADSIALLLMASSDGLQSHWLLDDTVDMAGQISHLWEALTRA